MLEADLVQAGVDTGALAPAIDGAVDKP